MFHVGQKVVCVNDKASPWTPMAVWDSDERIQEGEIYTILHTFTDVTGGISVHLQEVARCAEARAAWGHDVGYGVYRFRPLVERKTDISIFTRMLDPTRAPERV